MTADLVGKKASTRPTDKQVARAMETRVRKIERAAERLLGHYKDYDERWVWVARKDFERLEHTLRMWGIGSR